MGFAIDRATFLSLVAAITACTPTGTPPSEGASIPASASPLPNASGAGMATAAPSAPVASSQPVVPPIASEEPRKASEDQLGFDGDTVDHVDVVECARFSWWSCDEVEPPALRCSRAWKDRAGPRRDSYAACIAAWKPKSPPAATCAAHLCSRLHTASSLASRKLEECTGTSKDPDRSCAALRKKAEDASLRGRNCTKRTECGEDLMSCSEQSNYLAKCERTGRSVP